MKLLILGGTIFLGRHIAEIALKRGWDVTLFTRGQHSPNILPEAKKLIGDRNGNLSALEEGEWDAVIDTSCYFPRIARESAELLKPRVGHYVFISTISVYEDYAERNLDETYPVGIISDESVETITGETYGPLKALCELEVTKVFPTNSLNIRPGLIVGPNDISDRYTYWAKRIQKGGKILAPGDPEYPVQFIDVRDLANWTLDMTLQKKTGVYNATGPEKLLTMGEWLESIKTEMQSDCEFVWVDDEFLIEQDVGAYFEMPLWIPLNGDNNYFSEVSVEKAVRNGLVFRSPEESAIDALKWRETTDFPTRAGMTSEREEELLKLWFSKTSV